MDLLYSELASKNKKTNNGFKNYNVIYLFF